MAGQSKSVVVSNKGQKQPGQQKQPAKQESNVLYLAIKGEGIFPIRKPSAETPIEIAKNGEFVRYTFGKTGGLLYATEEEAKEKMPQKNDIYSNTNLNAGNNSFAMMISMYLMMGYNAVEVKMQDGSIFRMYIRSYLAADCSLGRAENKAFPHHDFSNKEYAKDAYGMFPHLEQNPDYKLFGAELQKHVSEVKILHDEEKDAEKNLLERQAKYRSNLTKAIVKLYSENGRRPFVPIIAAKMIFKDDMAIISSIFKRIKSADGSMTPVEQKNIGINTKQIVQVTPLKGVAAIPDEFALLYYGYQVPPLDVRNWEQTRDLCDVLLVKDDDGKLLTPSQKDMGPSLEFMDTRIPLYEKKGSEVEGSAEEAAKK